MKNLSITRSSAILLSTAISTTAFGSGFALNEQSARAMGQVYSGRVSDADNASTLMSNPAGMSFLKRGEISAGFSFIDATSDVSNVTSTAAGASVSGTDKGNMIPFSKIPFGYYVQPIDDHLAAGIGVYVPFGLVTDYEKDFQGRYFGTKSDIKVITVQPTVSYKFDNGLALGLGVTYNKFNGKLEKSLYNSLAPSSDINAGVKGDDTAWGYNVGALYEINPQTRIGLTYYSKVKYTLEGHTDLDNIPSTLGIGSTARYNASLPIETPDRIDVGFTHELTPQLTLHGDMTRTNWKTLKEIKVTNENTPLIFGSNDLAESVEPLDWKATMFYSLGLSYKIDAQWTVRGGLGYDKQPMPDSTRSVRLPAGDRKLLAFGTTWSPTTHFDLDVSYMYIKENSVSVDQTTTALVTNAPIEYSAKFDNTVSLLSMQASWKF